MIKNIRKMRSRRAQLDLLPLPSEPIVLQPSTPLSGYTTEESDSDLDRVSCLWRSPGDDFLGSARTSADLSLSIAAVILRRLQRYSVHTH